MSAREEAALRQMLRLYFLSGVMWGMVLLAVAVVLIGCGRGPVCVPPKTSADALPKPGNETASSTSCPVQK